MKLSEQKELQRDLGQLRSNMKAFLKNQSKKELIRMVLEHVDLYIDQQQLNKLLYEQNAELKAQLETLQPKEVK